VVENTRFPDEKALHLVESGIGKALHVSVYVIVAESDRKSIELLGSELPTRKFVDFIKCILVHISSFGHKNKRNERFTVSMKLSVAF
jgi:hypothetical protein